MAGVENFPEFNNYGACPSDPDGNMWPCVPHATMAHELGHAFGLPHPAEVESTHEVANHSVMQTHWNYPNNALDAASPWGLLTLERTTLWENPFFQEDIYLRQIYEADVVNLPVTGPVPAIDISSNVSGKNVMLSNNTTGAQLYYWTFGDGTVSNDKSPSHTYSQPGTYTIALRASGETGMTAMQQLTVEVKDPTKPVQRPISLGPLKIFPNPSVDGRFTVVYPKFPFAIRFTLPFLRLTILNSLGKVLATHTVSSVLESQQLDLSDYGRGVYYVRLELKGSSLTQKLVIL